MVCEIIRVNSYRGLFTAAPKLVEPDRDGGAVHVETTRVGRNFQDAITRALR